MRTPSLLWCRYVFSIQLNTVKDLTQDYGLELNLTALPQELKSRPLVLTSIPCGISNPETTVKTEPTKEELRELRLAYYSKP